MNCGNYSELSKGTRAWISEFNHLLDRSVVTGKGNKATIREAFEICFGLLPHVDECLDEVLNSREFLPNLLPT